MYLSEDAVLACMLSDAQTYSSIYSHLQQGRKMRQIGVAISEASCFY